MSEAETLPAALTDAIEAMRDRLQHNDESNSDTVSEADVNNININNWRNLIAFFILGLSNNYGYVVMLSAARDIIERFDAATLSVGNETTTNLNPRDCNLLSTGALLLASTVPALVAKLIASFLPFYIGVRMSIVCILSVMGFIAVAVAQFEWQAILGIVFMSISCGLGESSLLGYTPKFNRNVISSWSSGTGAAGVTGAFSYAALLSIGFTPETSLLMMLLVPAIQAIAFFIIWHDVTFNGNEQMSSSSATSTTSLLNNNRESNSVQTPPSFSQKMKYFPKLSKYVLPLFTVYVCEYFINQGLYELIYFPNIGMDHESQYRWLQVDYQIGVFISRSSISLFATKQLWLMTFLQFLNIFYFASEAIYMVTPSIWIVFVFVFWEGLLGGCCYVNTFNRMFKEIPEQYRSFGLGVAPIGESCGIIVAGLLAIPVHNVICKMPLPTHLRPIKY